MRGYYEANRAADMLGIPVSVMVINVMVNGIHWHDHAEILYCVKGKMHVRADGTAYLLQAGDFITINGGVSHEIYDGEPGDVQIICSIDSKMLGDMEGRSICCSTLEADGVEMEDARLIRQALSEMAWLCAADLSVTVQACRNQQLPVHPLQQEQNWNCYHMYLYQLMMVLVKYKKEGKKEGQHRHELIDSCAAHINQHLGEELNAGVLARLLHVSESTVYRLFSEQVGIALNEYITTVRLNAVCRCLEETTQKISAIAYECGFTGLSNFYRVFQKYVGMTPKEYRSTRKRTGARLLFGEPDIMKLNRYQNFEELGIGKEAFREMCRQLLSSPPGR